MFVIVREKFTKNDRIQDVSSQTLKKFTKNSLIFLHFLNLNLHVKFFKKLFTRKVFNLII